MPVLRSNLVSSNDNVASDTSSLHGMNFSNEVIIPFEKSSASLLEKNGYQDSIYLNAANIFQGIHNEKPQDKILVKYGNGPLPSLPDFKDEQFQRLSYELAFSALKYQDVLENILVDSGIYPMQSISDQLTSLVVVMLYDLQDRKFEARYNTNDEEPIAEVQEVEHYLCSFKTKLAAALARCRIKHDALSIEHILPETIRKQEQRASALPLYAWVNMLKISLEEVHNSLQKEGFTKVESVSNLGGYSYCLDKHCEDVLIFPSILKEKLLALELFTNYKLLLQDKSRSLALHSVKALLNMDDDVLIAHMGSWLTLAHMSVLTNQETSKVFVCGIKSMAKESELKDLFTQMECKNIELLHEDFTNIESTDHKLQKVKVILLLPRCSGLGVSNPIEFILKEHEDAELLRDLSQGCVAEDKLNTLAQQQLKELTHAMQFSKAQAVVYCTCSVYPEENEAVVNKALASGAGGTKAQPYKLCPPVLPLCCKSEISTSTENFFKLEPSDISNSCFIAVLTRERDPSESVSVKDVLARAAAKGLLEGIDLAKPAKREEKKKKKQKVTQSKTATKEAVIQSRIQEFLDREMKPSTIESDTSISNLIASASQRTVNQTNGSILLKKTAKPLSNSSLPVMSKNSLTSSSMQKMFEKQRNIRKPKSDDRVMVLKPVEIVLPPVMIPYFNPQGNRSQISSNHYYYNWGGTSGMLSPSASKKLIKTKEPSPSTAKHSRPWL
ncbi:putative methyltransferase NSUN7 isoform X1 [Rhineura floridana]|uniref:putative methyltransferase NSUN7 isoform X1 n=1 Tax=Rhineura floridana TaxID=261503 RepID=UPI002AC84299|nr:putative methyltransferase NSUN7 isoform X1 [Rhineura floridana]XP_061440413.1 putative methyltransferase NSUN7 isoform X1 [Rhineura floridana]XP_061440414.1 putative methyltransferase NSUN7 isoform X1 [Rhineura floridana]XP_061440415.1 putative methyltransferase NSUN7 isoform X1 [Rhineura floridana]XP_061440416.1 putative methyltransferase NSUN7 isoform X1 [Rhineura floridana]XP_061440417.1 putative methyltransferase NSUN7 isoform X1 [Rhineura floridana]